MKRTPPRQLVVKHAINKLAMPIITSFILLSCQKDENQIPVLSDPIGQAKQLVDGLRQHPAHHHEPLDYQLRYESKVAWENATVYRNNTNDSTIVFVGLETDQALYVSTTDHGNVKLTTDLRITMLPDSKWAIDLITYVPQHPGPIDNSFSGTVVFASWDGSKEGYSHVLDGKHYRDVRKMMGSNTVCYAEYINAYVNGILNTVYKKEVCTEYPEGDDGPTRFMVAPDRGGGGGRGNSTNNNTTVAIDINTNEIDDPCLKQTIEKALTYSESAMGLISDIIQELDGNVGLQIDIKVVDDITRKGKPGEATEQNFTSIGGVPKIFESTIILHEEYMPDVWLRNT